MEVGLAVDEGVVLVVDVGLLTVGFTVELVVDETVLRTGVAAVVPLTDVVAFALLLAVASLVLLAVDARDNRFGFAVIPSRFDSSPEASTEVVEGRVLCSELVAVVAVLEGLFTVAVVVVGRVGGLLNEVGVVEDVRAADVDVGLVAELVVEVKRGATGFVTGRFAVLVRRVDVLSSPAVAREEGRLDMLACVLEQRLGMEVDNRTNTDEKNTSRIGH